MSDSDDVYLDDELKTARRDSAAGEQHEAGHAARAHVRKEGKGKGKTLTRPKSGHVDRSQAAGLYFKVGRINKAIKNATNNQRVAVDSSVFLAAVLQYLVSEVLDLAGSQAKMEGKKRITPQHILFAVRSDHELDVLLQRVTIAAGGVAALSASFAALQKSAQAKSAQNQQQQEDEDEDF